MKFNYTPQSDDPAAVEKLRLFYECSTDEQLVKMYNRVIRDCVLTGTYSPRECYVIATIMQSRFSKVPIRVEGNEYHLVEYAWMENGNLTWLAGYSSCRMNQDTAIQVYYLAETSWQISTVFVMPESPSTYLRMIGIIPANERDYNRFTMKTAIYQSYDLENEFMPFWVSFADKIESLQEKWKKYQRINEAPYFVKITKKGDGYWRVEPSVEVLFRRFITKQLVIPQPDILVPQLYRNWFEG
ncbi:MAG: hypothetical protein HUU10_09510 [Bacteroidetes bacterium]|nr:hypothetical protein [Bacteroidota bacterium]